MVVFYQLYFLLSYAWYVHTVHTFFYYTKTLAILMRREHQNNAPTSTAVGRHQTGYGCGVVFWVESDF